jgi:transcriptional regulator GlxA family with amidase domain
MQIAILIFDELTALDAIGPYEVLSRLPGAEVRFVAAEPGLKRTDNGMLALLADDAVADVPHPEVIVVPGGVGMAAVAADPRVLDWLRATHATSTWTTSVCTGALVLGAAGLLDGLRATTHFLRLDALRDFGAQPTGERVVREGKVITAAGVSAGIDMALTLAAEIAGEDVAKAIQLVIEYDPQPPFDAGSAAKAGPGVVALLEAGVRAREEAAAARAAAV